MREILLRTVIVVVIGVFTIIGVSIGSFLILLFTHDYAKDREIHQAEQALKPQPVYRVYGQFLRDDEPDYGRSGLPKGQFQLKVHHIETDGSTPSKRYTPQVYALLSWEKINNGFIDVYSVDKTLAKYLNKYVQITGVVYTMCNAGLYLRDIQDTEQNCFL